MDTVVLASRASALAMAQSRWVASRLAECGVASTILNLTTTGDRVQDRAIAAIGSINVWVKELEIALRDGRADYAVHSSKDLPSELEPDMTIAAISRREDPRDAFCSERYTSFEALPSGAVVGTSSLRRRALLQALRDDLRYEDIRGNVDTRLRKLREGQYDAIVLAAAGLKRLGVSATHVEPFETTALVPAAGQGALAVETLASNGELAARLYDAVNDPPSELCVRAERAALRALRAGCSAPIGVHATTNEHTMTIAGAYAQPERGVVIHERVNRHVDTVAAAEALGAELAAALDGRLEVR
jgi:hydroxymethylbilane synthase